ncbi:MAG: S9 family peptidase [Prolixibacteraceae bacterium]|nr:S9 family peptidase [Prolixibacteraceae bacterium]MBT7393600.1 S9 family peptidase [Prolixibacteraceae bacterium]
MRIFIIFLLFVSQLAYSQNKQMSLEDAVFGRYTYLMPEKVKGLSWKNARTYTFVENDTLWAASVKNNDRFPVFCLKDLNTLIKKESEFKFASFPNYSWENDSELLVNNLNEYFLLNLDEKEVLFHIKLPEKAENAVINIAGKFVAFTIDNDLFVKFSTGKTVQITSDGGNGIVNGKTVHRNEFGINNGIFNSPGGNFIAFYRKDESMVKDYPLVDFMARGAEYTPVKYPMAGMKSHQVKLGIYNVESGASIFLNTGEPLDHYLTNVVWSPDEKNIYIVELNRGQNHMKLNCYDINSGENVKTLFEEKSDKYVEPLLPIQFSKVNENEFYYLSRKDGWFHIYKYNIKGELIQQITKGEWEVTRIMGFDSQEKFAFIEATIESPLENHIYKVEIKTGKIEKITSDPGIHNGLLGPEAVFVIDNWNSKNVPHKTDLISTKGKLIQNLHSAKNPLQDYILGENSLVTIKTANGKTDLHGRLIKPVNFDPNKKYPVIVYVYGGPHSQLVNKAWHNSARWWQYYMASQGYISFTLDNRGTKNRGRDFETDIHRRLGVLETQDQMQGIEYLKSLPFVDAGRIGVHGWSYGGFMTLNLMLHQPETFKVGVAGGPVVDWSLYEIMYGERYMDTPQENPKGYQETNLLNYVSNLNAKLMLIHDVQDQTVVMQHSMRFLRECVKQEKQVDFFVYPTHPHNVRGKDRVHLVEKVSRYFLDNL